MVIVKAALTLDGNLAAADGSSQWITGEEARRDAHRVRASVDAVMVGAGTVLADDPQLTVRLDGYDGPQPVPVIVVGRRPMPPAARLLSREPILLTPHAATGRVVVVPDASGERVDLAAGLQALAGLGIERVLVEGGAGLVTGLLAAGLVDRGILYYGAMLGMGTGLPLLAGTAAHRVTIDSATMIDRDLRVDVSFTPPS